MQGGCTLLILYLPVYQGVSDCGDRHSHQAPPRNTLGLELVFKTTWVGDKDWYSVLGMGYFFSNLDLDFHIMYFCFHFFILSFVLHIGAVIAKDF